MSPVMTVTTAEQVVVPAGPTNVPAYVVVLAEEGSRFIEPEGETFPILVIVPPVALVLLHLTVTLPPTVMVNYLQINRRQGLQSHRLLHRQKNRQFHR